MTTQLPFHLAFTVRNLDEARRFYHDILGCPEGRSDTHWVDFNFFGHQIVAHLDETKPSCSATSTVDEQDVPVPHFGAILDSEGFAALCSRLREANDVRIFGPFVRFSDAPGEQTTMFIQDPSGNALEFKTFDDLQQIFAR